MVGQARIDCPNCSRAMCQLCKKVVSHSHIREQLLIFGSGTDPMLLVTHLDIVVVVILVWGDTLQKSLRL